MRSFLQFFAVWAGYAAFVATSCATCFWLLSIDAKPNEKRVASSLLWGMFWPLAWLYYRLIGTSAISAGHRGVHSGMKPRASEQRFRTIREAKDYLADRIAAEAECAGTPLTEIERKMLYFTETGWTLPDMKDVSAEFDRDYDQDAYEHKIGELACRIQSRMTANQQEQSTWKRALEKLSQGDHYLVVLVDATDTTQKGARHNLKILISALVLFALAGLDIWLRRWMRDH